MELRDGAPDILKELARIMGALPDHSTGSFLDCYGVLARDLAGRTFASLAIQDHKDPEWLRNQLGYYSAAYTLETYSHFLRGPRDMSFAEFGA